MSTAAVRPVGAPKLVRLVGLAVALLAAGCAALGVPTPAAQRTAGPGAGTVLASCDVGPPSGNQDSRLFHGVFAAYRIDGSDVVGTSYLAGRRLVVVLHAFAGDCRPVAGFGRNGTATLSVPDASRGALIDTMSAAPGGRLLVGGSDGTLGLLGRLLPDGRPDPSFGTGGWVQLRPREEPLESAPPVPVLMVTSVAVSPGGTIYVGGSDQLAHCCVSDLIGALTPAGRPRTSFGDQGWVDLGRKVAATVGGFVTYVLPDGSDGVLSMSLVEYMGCGGPVLVRLDAAGRLDQQFDRAAARSIATASPPRLAFAATIFARPGGGFGLIGDDVAEDCGGPARSHGLAVGLRSDGQLDPAFGSAGRTSFPSDNDELFGAAWTVPAPGGALLLITEQLPANGAAPGHLVVRELTPDGKLDMAFARGGAAEVDISPVVHGDPFPQITVAAAAGHQLLAVIGTTSRIELLYLAG